MVAKAEPLFDLGRVVGTPGALAALEEAGQSASEFLRLHVVGNWGIVDEEDQEANNEALRDGSRLLSAYCLDTGVKVWLITEAVDESGKRAATTILLPEEY